MASPAGIKNQNCFFLIASIWYSSEMIVDVVNQVHPPAREY